MKKIKPFPETKAIWIEWRGPQNTEEKGIWGETDCNNENTARVFINRNKKNQEVKKTFWHEMFHVYCHFYGIKLNNIREENLARRVEEVVWGVIRP